MRSMTSLILLVATALAGAEEPSYIFRMKLLQVAGAMERPENSSSFLVPQESNSPAYFSIGDKDYQFVRNELLMADGSAPAPSDVVHIGSPSITTGVGEASMTMGDTTPLEYVEQAAGGEYHVRKSDVELGTTCTIKFHGAGPVSNGGQPIRCDVSLSAMWATSGAQLDGVGMPVGPPLLHTVRFSDSLELPPAQTYVRLANATPAGGASPVTLIFILEAAPTAAADLAAAASAANALEAQETRCYQLEARFYGINPKAEAGLLTAFKPVHQYADGQLLDESMHVMALEAPANLSEAEARLLALEKLGIELLSAPRASNCIPTPGTAAPTPAEFQNLQRAPDGSRAWTADESRSLDGLRVAKQKEIAAFASSLALTNPVSDPNSIFGGGDFLEGTRAFDQRIPGILQAYVGGASRPLVILDTTTKYFKNANDVVEPITLGLGIVATAVWDEAQQKAVVPVYLNQTYFERPFRRPAGALLGTPTYLEYAAKEGETRAFYRRRVGSEVNGHLLILLTLHPAEPAAGRPTTQFKMVLRNQGGSAGASGGGFGGGGQSVPAVERGEASTTAPAQEVLPCEVSMQLYKVTEDGDLRILRGLGLEPDTATETLYRIPLPAAGEAGIEQIRLLGGEKELIATSAPRLREITGFQALPDILPVPENPDFEPIANKHPLETLASGTRGLTMEYVTFLQRKQAIPSGDIRVTTVAKNLPASGPAFINEFDMLLAPLVDLWKARDLPHTMIADVTSTFYEDYAGQIQRCLTGSLCGAAVSWDANGDQALVQLGFSLNRTQTRRDGERRVLNLIRTPTIVEYTCANGESAAFYRRNANREQGEHILMLVTVRNRKSCA